MLELDPELGGTCSDLRAVEVLLTNGIYSLFETSKVLGLMLNQNFGQYYSAGPGCFVLAQSGLCWYSAGQGWFTLV